MSRLKPSDLINAFNAGNSWKNNQDKNKRDEEKWGLEKTKLQDEEQKRKNQMAAAKAVQQFFQADYVDAPTSANPNPTNPVAQGVQPTGNPAAIQGDTSTANASPAAAQGIQAQPGAAQQQFQAPTLDNVSDRIQEAQRLALQYPEHAERFKAYETMAKQNVMVNHAKAYEGNPAANPIAYMKHMAEAEAKVGGYLTPDQVKTQSEYIKKMEKEGFSEALDYVKSGNIEAANKAWDRGDFRGTIDVDSVKTVTKTVYGQQVEGKEFTVINKDMSKQTYNTIDLDMQKLKLEQQIKASQAQEKHETDIKNTKDQINKRADGNLEVVAGADDQHLLNKSAGKTQALNVGVKAAKGDGGKRDGYGRTRSELNASKKLATTVFDKSVNVSNGQFGLQGLKEEDGKLYSAVTETMYSLVQDYGWEEGKAANQAKDLATAIWKAQEGAKPGDKTDHIKEILGDFRAAMQKQSNTGGADPDDDLFGIGDDKDGKGDNTVKNPAANGVNTKTSTDTNKAGSTKADTVTAGVTPPPKKQASAMDYYDLSLKDLKKERLIIEAAIKRTRDPKAKKQAQDELDALDRIIESKA